MPKTMVGEFNSIKFSLFHYPYPLIKPLFEYEEIYLASPQDIASMKLVAITDRGTKKDFVDLYFLAQKKFHKNSKAEEKEKIMKIKQELEEKKPEEVKK